MPIDIASGAVHSNYRDIRIAGRFPLAWGRSYNSALSHESASHLGAGWTNPFFAKLTRIGKDYHFRGASGAVIQFPDPDDTVERQGIIRDFGSFHEIERQGFNLRVTNWNADGTIHRFFFKPNRNGEWWPLRSVENAAGNGLELAWDEHERLKGIRQKHEKRTLAVTYSPAERIASVSFRHPDGRQQILARYDYDSMGRLSSAQDAMGYSERYEYDASGKLSREIAKDGGIFTFKYDDNGRCIRSHGLDNYDLKILRYLDHISWTEVTNGLGKTSRYQWSGTGQIVMHIDPMGAKTETEYDEHGRILSKTGPMGEKTSYEYDGEGNRAKLVDALGNESLFEYNAQHLVVKFTDANGHEWARSYDESNRPASATDPLGNRTSIEYDRVGNPTLLKKADGSVSKRTYSEAGNLAESTDWSGHATVFDHDEFGRIVKRMLPDGRVSTNRYDLLGRIVQVTYDSGKIIKYEYDAGGNVVLVTSTAESPVSFKYGTCRRLLEKRYGAGQKRRYAWGSEPDRLEKVFNETGETYAFHYDDCDRVASEIGFDGRKTSFKYNLSGHCIGRTNNLGQFIDWERDSLGRVLSENMKDETPSSFQYDKTGNLLSAENAWSKLSFERDAAGRSVKEDQSGFGISRGYGPTGEVLHLESDAGIHFGYSYDGNGFMTSVDANGLGVFNYTRNERNQIASLAMPGGLDLNHTYDSRGRLLKQTVSEGGSGSNADAALIEREYAYDDSNMLLAVSDGQWGKSRYSHDDAQRLVQFGAGEFRTDYILNPIGDPISLLRNGTEETPFSYAPGGTLTRQGSFAYEYDEAGRLISKTDRKESDPSWKWSYSWDAKDRLRSFTSPAGESWEYAYDPFGRRCLKKNRDREVRFIWDKDVLLHEIETGKETLTWGFEPHGFRPLFKIQKGSLYSIVLDHLGTPREMLDTSSRIVWSAHLDPWGNPIEGKGDLEDCPFRFQGQYFDRESGLHYNRFRYYDPGMGRFISRDPILLSGGVSSYQYVPNSTRWIDPLGLCGEEDETLYRAMSEEDFEVLQRTGRMPATTETTTSPTQAFSEDYDGVLVEFKLKPGTIAELESIGVSDGSPLTREQYPDMPIGAKGWAAEHARFKQEGDQINIALGKGTALDTFNDNITGYNVVR